MHPQNTSWCASQRACDRWRMKPSREQLRADEGGKRGEVPGSVLAERVPPSPVEHAGRGPFEPHRVPVDDPEHREDDAEEVADERGVEPDEAVAPDEGQGDDERDADGAPGHPAPVEAVGCRHHLSAANRSSSSTTIGNNRLFSLWM